MSATVRIPTPLRKLTNNEEIVEVSGTTVEAVMTELQSRYPGIKERLLDESDVDLVNWMTGRDQPPAALHSDILSLLLNFKIPIAST